MLTAVVEWKLIWKKGCVFDAIFYIWLKRGVRLVVSPQDKDQGFTSSVSEPPLSWILGVPLE
jgi:hypothetical protein